MISFQFQYTLNQVKTPSTNKVNINQPRRSVCRSSRQHAFAYAVLANKALTALNAEFMQEYSTNIRTQLDGTSNLVTSALFLALFMQTAGGCSRPLTEQSRRMKLSNWLTVK
jgi:hypothetical protein